jgi:uncharacterized protein (DUF58 family)
MATAESPASTSRPDRYIDPQTLMSIRSLELRAKSVVEGLQNGLNRSPYHGFSVEFTEYRQYTPGDDPRYLDWKLYARTDKYYIKLYEDETNLRCQLLLDLSQSMGYGSLGYPKIEYARTLAATFAHFLSTQRDAVGLLTFDEHVDEFIPARYRVGHLRRLMVALERKTAGTATDISRPLQEAADRLHKRGMVVLISDLLAPIHTLQTNLGFLRARGQEVVLFQILDPAELNFDFDQESMFEDLETGKRVYVDPSTARDSYLQRFHQHQDTIRSTCEKLGIMYRQFSTDQPMELVLAEFLRARQSVAGRRVRARGGRS